MQYLAANAQHIGAREYQQDSFGFADLSNKAFLEHGGFLTVLCDGMGGMEHGDVASQTAVRAVLDSYARKAPDETIPEALERSVREANNRVFETAEQLGKAQNVGTTLVAAVMHNEALYFASVGDSGLFHVSGGQLRMVNQPHIYANLLDRAVAAGAISQEQAAQHPEREALTSYVGIPALQEIDRNSEPWPLRSGDTILLSSDGMFKTLEEHEILSTVAGKHPRSWPQALVQQTLDKDRPGQDNVTVLAVTLNPVEAAPANASSRKAAPLAFAAMEKKSSNRKLLTGVLIVIAAAIIGFLYFR